MISSDPLVARLRSAGCVFADDEAALLRAAAGGSALDSLVERRVAGEPLEHVLGWVHFAGRRIAVTPGVFVPRRRTELLAQAAAAALPAGGVAVDLCCGAGAVAAVLADRAGEVHAVDIDGAAVACARRNLAGGRVYQADLFAPLPGALHGRVDVVAANAPYVPSDAIGAMPREAREHEPLVALDGGADGLDIARRIVAGAPAWLAPGGWLLVETSTAQAAPLAAAFIAAGLSAEVLRDDERAATIVRGQLSTSPPLV